MTGDAGAFDVESSAEDLIGFIDASPTPYHAVQTAAARLDAAGFARLDPRAEWGDGAGGPSYVVRDGSLVAWSAGRSPAPSTPMRIIGAHTDSPGLRVRPRPDRSSAGFRQLAVEVYGGALRNSWLDRDLGLAGRVAVTGSDGTLRHVCFRSDTAVMRVPQLAIHLDRDVSTNGLVIDAQQHLTPVWGLGSSQEGDFRAWLASSVASAPEDVVAWEAIAFDSQPGAVIGVDGGMIAAARLDDLACCWGAVGALVTTVQEESSAHPCVIVLNDHEEVGSTTATGADGAWFEQVLERRAVALGGARVDLLRSLASASLLSADMAHATHPNHPERHEPGHWIRLGGGPVIKHNVNARYATDSRGAALFRAACNLAGIPVQDYSHRGDLPCGSTTGPLVAARLAIDTVDVGMAMLSMHSARELMATADVGPMRAAFTAWFGAA